MCVVVSVCLSSGLKMAGLCQITYFIVFSMATFNSELKLQINIIAAVTYLFTKRVSNTKFPSGAEFKIRGSLLTRLCVSACVHSLELKHIRFHSVLNCCWA